MNKIYLIVLSVFLVVLAGCGLIEKEVEVDGSVFVVTTGGKNIKLGLIPVAALTKEEFMLLESANIEWVNKFYDENSSVYKKAKAEYDRLYEEKLVPIRTEYESARATYNSLRDSYDFTGDRYRKGVHIRDGDVHVRSFYAERDSSIYNHAKSIQAELNTEKLKVNLILEKYSEIREQIRQYKKIVDEIAEEANDRILSYQRSLAQQACSRAQIKTKTNADGEFSLTLSKGMDYVLVAYAYRSVGDSTEEYNWFIPCASPLGQDGEILISNDNLESNTSNVTLDLYEFKNSRGLPYLYPWDTEPVEIIID